MEWWDPKAPSISSPAFRLINANRELAQKYLSLPPRRSEDEEEAGQALIKSL